MLTDLPVWGLAVSIFSLRVVDVSLGTLRTLVVVQGRVPVAMALGFVELLLWVTALSQVIIHIGDHPALAFAYAGGFAAGNGAGILLERRLALGSTALRLVTKRGIEVEAAVGPLATIVATINGSADGGQVQLMYATCRRRDLPTVITHATSADSNLFYVIERFAETSGLVPLAPVTGWRAILKKK